VTLKVHDHRTTSYPIVVAVDGHVVWRGDVGQTLGYNTIEFAPTTGRSVTIALEGVTHVQDPFGDLVEVTGARDQAGGEKGRGRLDLVEVELYAPVEGGGR
jgi:hypothetical protein